MTDPDHPRAEHEAERPSKQIFGMNLAAILRSKTGLVTLALVGGVGVSLAVEHQTHLIEWLPWLLVMACPLMHVFMHKGHGGHAGHGHDAPHSDASHARVPATTRREPRE